MESFSAMTLKLTLDVAAFETGGDEIIGKADEISKAISGMFEKSEKKSDEFKDKMKEAGKAVGEMFSKAGESAKGLFEKLKIGDVLEPITKMFTAPGLVDFGKHALEVSDNFEKLELRLTGVTQSAARAKQIMEFSEKQSSLFGLAKPEELDAAAIKLEAYRLKAEEFLPVIEKLAMISGGGSADLAKFADAFGKIAQGHGDEGIQELRNAGISIEDMQRAGVKFKRGENGDPKLASSPREALAGLSSAVEDRFRPVENSFMNSPAASAQRFANVWSSALLHVGKAIEGVLGPIRDQASEAMGKIVSGGQLDRIIAGFTSLVGKGLDVKGIIQKIADAIEGIPKWLKEHQKDFQQIWESVKGIAKAVGSDFVPVLNHVLETAKTILSIFQKLPEPVQQAVIGFMTINKVTGGAAGNLTSALAKAGLSKLKDKGIGGAVSAAENAAEDAAPQAEKALVGLLPKAAEAGKGLLVTAGRAVLGGMSEFVTTGGLTGMAGVAVAGVVGALLGGAEIMGLEAWKAHEQEAEDKAKQLAAGMAATKRVNGKDVIIDPEFAKRVKEHKDPYAEEKAKAKAEKEERHRKQQEEEQATADRANEEAKAKQADEETKVRAAQQTMIGEPKENDGDTLKAQSAIDTSNNYLRQIEQHTEQAPHDLSKHALGGGDLGRLGVTPIEMSRMNRGGGAAGRLMQAIDQFVAEYTNRNFAAVVRQGIVPTR